MLVLLRMAEVKVVSEVYCGDAELVVKGVEMEEEGEEEEEVAAAATVAAV